DFRPSPPLFFKERLEPAENSSPKRKTTDALRPARRLVGFLTELVTGTSREIQLSSPHKVGSAARLQVIRQPSASNGRMLLGYRQSSKAPTKSNSAQYCQGTSAS